MASISVDTAVIAATDALRGVTANLYVAEDNYRAAKAHAEELRRGVNALSEAVSQAQDALIAAAQEYPPILHGTRL